MEILDGESNSFGFFVVVMNVGSHLREQVLLGVDWRARRRLLREKRNRWDLAEA